jgi:hypothetical protein
LRVPTLTPGQGAEGARRAEAHGVVYLRRPSNLEDVFLRLAGSTLEGGA